MSLLKNIFGSGETKPAAPEIPKIDKLIDLFTDLENKRKVWHSVTMPLIIDKLESLGKTISMPNEVRKVHNIINKEHIIFEFKKRESGMSYNTVVAYNSENKLKGNVFVYPGRLVFSASEGGYVLVQMYDPTFDLDKWEGKPIGAFALETFTNEFIEELMMLFLGNIGKWFEPELGFFSPTGATYRERDEMGRFI